MLKILNDLLSFLLELAMLTAFAYAGFYGGTNPVLDYILGIGIPLLVIVFWAKWMAPKARNRLPFPWVQIVTLFLIEAGAAALYISGVTKWAFVFAVIALINVGLKLLFRTNFT